MAAKFFNRKLSAKAWFSRRLAAAGWFDPIIETLPPSTPPTFNPAWASGVNVVVQAGLGL